MIDTSDIEDIAIEQYLISQQRTVIPLRGVDDCSPHEMRFESGLGDRGTKESRRLHHLSAREKVKLCEEFYRKY